MKEAGEPSVNSLIVAIGDDKIFARRFELAEKNSDLAVLIAQSVNPRAIAAPYIAHKGTLQLHKIVGVLFESDSYVPGPNTINEIEECKDQNVLTRISSQSLGLVEVVGSSAVPTALDKQFLILSPALTAGEAAQKLIGKVVVASDSDGEQYFKRLQMPNNHTFILESIAIGGEYAPLLFDQKESSQKTLLSFWPVAGVLFERP